MKEPVKTLLFVGVALTLLGAAITTHYITRPEPIKQFELVGEPFYPEFEDPADAIELEVAARDEESGQLHTFKVAFEEGLWRIPTHHGYPAEAEERLAGTAASVIGIEREALVGRRKSEHARYGVVDPMDEENDDPDAAGKRIILRDNKENVLADYIIGKVVENQPEQDFASVHGGDQVNSDRLHYVRRPDEDETYIARIQVDVKTRFADWIEQDLLRIDQQNFVDVKLTEFGFADVTQGPFIVGRRHDPEADKTLHLSKTDGSWEIEGLNDEEEEFQSSPVWSLTSALRGLEIVGVRPKPKFNGELILTPDLTVNQPKGPVDRTEWDQATQELQSQLSDLGFMLMSDSSEGNGPQQLRLLSEQGELVAATDLGVVYHLHFGNSVVGDDDAIEFGGEGESSSGDEGDDETDEEESSESKRNRYVYLRVEFDPQFIGEKPVEPVKPTPPPKEPENQPTESDNADDASPDASNDDTDGNAANENQNEGQSVDDSSSGNSDSPTDEGDSAETDSAEPDADNDDVDTDDTEDAEAGTSEKDTDAESADATESNDETEPKPDPEAKYQQAIFQYQQDLSAYEADLKEYEEKAEQGQRRVRQLNERYNDWYYVISSSSFDDLWVTREDVVKPKEKPEETPGDSPDDSAPDDSSPDDSTPDDASSDDSATDQPEEDDSPTNDAPTNNSDDDSDSDSESDASGESENPNSNPSVDDDADSPEDSSAAPETDSKSANDE